MKDQFTTKGFADYIIEARGTVNIFLDKIDKLINWQDIEKTLENKYKKERALMAARHIPHYPCLSFYFFNAGMV